jgi:hypothetical protein
MCRNILSLRAATIIPMIFFILATNTLSSEQWSYVGVAKTDNGNSFYLFLDKDKKHTGDNKIQFREKHDFNKPQSLPSGKRYNSVVITRIIDCKELKIADTEAVFIDAKKRTVDSYSAVHENGFTDILLKNDVNYEVFKIICDK